MYISNSSNIGMATLLQNNKNCMKTLTNGGATAGGSHIIVGNVVTTTSGGGSNNILSNQQVGGIVSSVPNLATTNSVVGGNVGVAGGGGSGNGTVTTLGGSLVLPAQTQTILLTNGATGASTIITYQQYQQLLQQQQQQQQQRLLVSQNLVNLPIGNLVSTGNGGMAVITTSNTSHSNHLATTSTAPTTSTTSHQGAFLVATSNAATGVSQFQQQLQQHLQANGATLNNQNNSVVTTSTYLQPTTQQQPRLITTSAGQIRHFSQFSQQQQPATINIGSSTPLNSQQQRTTVLINRNNNTIIAGNATQRLQHATILTTAAGAKTSATFIKTQTPTNATGSQSILVNNAATMQQVLNAAAGKGQIINVVKSASATKNLLTKTGTATITANLPTQQRFGAANIQHIRPQQQQLKIVTTQNIPQRATILNNISSSTPAATLLNSHFTKNVVNNNKTQITGALLPTATRAISASSLKATTVNATASSTALTSSSSTLSSLPFSTITSASLTPIQQQQTTTTHRQINGGHFTNNYSKHPNNTTNLQQPASKLVPNGHVIHHYTTANTNSNSNNNHNIINNNNNIASKAPTSSSTTTTSTNSQSLSSFATPNSASLSALSSSNATNTTTTNSFSANTAAVAQSANANIHHHHPQNNAQTYKTVNDFNTAIPNSVAATTEASSNSSANNSVTTVAPATAAAPAVVEQEAEPEPEIDIVINNVVCSFSVRCHLNLREIALNGANVEYRRENGMVTMKLRRPYTTASIWSSGRITCTGATSEEQAKIAARRYARVLGKLGFRSRFHNFRVVNVLGTCSMPWAIKIVNFSEKYREEASYEPELHPGVTYKLRYPKATLKIFSTGSITVTAASVAHVQAAIEHIFPLVYEFRKKRSPEELEQLRLKQLQNATFENLHQPVPPQPSAVNTEGGDIANPLRRPISNTFTKFPNAKRKCTKIGGGVDGEDEPDADDPDKAMTGGGGICDDDDDMVMYDPNESIIAGPDDDDL